VTSARTVLVVLVAATHLGAATLPCPVPSGEGAEQGVGAPSDGPSAHAVDDHGPGSAHAAGHAAHRAEPEAPGSAHAPGAEMAARCTCGCGTAAVGGDAAGRLGPALLRASAVPVPPPRARAAPASGPTLPDAPPRVLDPVPI